MQERSAGTVARFIRLPVIHIRIRQGDMANLTGLVNQDQINRMFIKQSRETAVYQRYFDRISLSGQQNRRSRHLLQLDTVTEMVPDIIEYIPFRYRAIFPDEIPIRHRHLVLPQEFCGNRSFLPVHHRILIFRILFLIVMNHAKRSEMLQEQAACRLQSINDPPGFRIIGVLIHAPGSPR